MSRRGKWLVMCPASRALPMADVLEKIKMPREAKAALDGEVLVLTVPTADGEEAELWVWLSTEEVVADEAVEFTEEYGAERADRDQIATYDARYVIAWNLAESEYVFETYYTLAFRLTDAVGGITLDLIEKTFVEA